MSEDFAGKVAFCSPLLDPAATPALAVETVDLCEVLLRLTRFHIRLLSRSPDLARIVARDLHRRLPGTSKARVIFGLAIGAFDSEQPLLFETGPLPSRQIKALHWLQDQGFRVFATIGSLKTLKCQRVPDARTMRIVRVDRCEAVFTELPSGTDIGSLQQRDK